MNTLSEANRVQVISALVEGNSIRATVRMTGVAKNTIVKLLAEVGTACAEYQRRAFRNLPCRRIQCDEIWSFCYAKQKNVPADKQGLFGYGDVWTWTAICADTKLVPSWIVGTRDAGTAFAFMNDLAGRLANRVQLTTYGHRVYLNAVEAAFGADIDYAMLVKIYGNDPRPEEARYSSTMHWGDGQHDNRKTESALHFDEFCGAAKSNDAHGNAPFYEANEWLLQESRKSRTRGRAPLHALQLLPHPPNAQGHPGDGSGDCRPCVVNWRNRRTARRNKY